MGDGDGFPFHFSVLFWFPVVTLTFFNELFIIIELWGTEKTPWQCEQRERKKFEC